MLVYIGIPVFDGKPYAALVDSLLAEQLRGFSEGVHFLVDWEPGCSLIGHARNKIVKRFMACKEASCLVFVDSDISWKAGDLIGLAKRRQPVIGGTYRAKTEDETFHVRGPVYTHGKLFEVSGLPGGFLKISRSVFMKVNAALYDFGGTVLADYFPTGLKDGVFWGEDYGFCRLWREYGGKIWLDPSIVLKHHDGLSVYTGDPAKWLKERQHGAQ